MDTSVLSIAVEVLIAALGRRAEDARSIVDYFARPAFEILTRVRGDYDAGLTEVLCWLRDPALSVGEVRDRVAQRRQILLRDRELLASLQHAFIRSAYLSHDYAVAQGVKRDAFQFAHNIRLFLYGAIDYPDNWHASRYRSICVMLEGVERQILTRDEAIARVEAVRERNEECWQHAVEFYGHLSVAAARA